MLNSIKQVIKLSKYYFDKLKLLLEVKCSIFRSFVWFAFGSGSVPRFTGSNALPNHPSDQGSGVEKDNVLLHN